MVTPGARDAALVAFHKKTGREIWRAAIPDLGEHGSDGAGYSSAVIADVVEDPEATVFVQRAEDRRWIDWLLADLGERGRRILAWHLGLGLS